jgi:ParB/RepB/Spo0J family partition protein
VNTLIPCRFQPRTTFRQEALNELAASIGEHGVLTRLLVFANERGELELIAGERRLRAATQAGLDAVPVELFSGTLSQIAEIAAIENVQREDLTPLEEGASYEQLITDLGISEAELARRLGKPRTYVQQRRMLVRAAPELQQALTEGAASFTQLRAVVQAAPGDHKAQREALKELRSRSAAGQRVTEDAAREIAEREVLKGSAKALKQLGWQSRRRPRGDILLWSDGDRPRVTAGAELLDILRSARRPTPATPVAERPLSVDQEALLRVRGYRLNDKEYAPWIAVSQGWAEPDRWLTPAEVADELLPSVAADIAELYEAFRAEGWAFKMADGMLTVVGAKHGTVLNPYDWSRARQVLEEIRRGAIVDSPQPKTGGSQAASRRACQDGRACGGKKHRIDTMTHLDGKFVCAACRDAIAAAEAALREQCDAATDLRAAPWAAACPDDLLRLFILGCMGSSKRLGFEQHDPTDKKLQIIAAHSRADLEAALVDVLRYIAWRYRETPLALDLAAPVAPPVPTDSPADPPAAAPEEPPPLSERFADIAFAIDDTREFTLPTLERWRDQLQALYTEACADPDDLDLAALSRDIDLLIGEVEGWIAAASQGDEVEQAA